MIGHWLYEGLLLIIGIGLLVRGLRPGRDIVVAQRAFFIACGLGVLCGLALPLVDARPLGNIFDFGIIVCAETALLSLLIWRFPRLTKAFVDSDNWHTPTT